MVAAFAFVQKSNKPTLRKLTSWVEDALPESMDEVTVMVNELQCFEPGCAPLETVVTLLCGPRSIIFKIFKECVDVRQDELLSGLETALAGQQHPEHLLAAPG